MQVGDQLHVSASLSSVKEPPVPGIVWAPRTNLGIRGEKNVLLLLEIESRIVKLVP
jgi:hypothetical protein